jgi:hypothetical protein
MPVCADVKQAGDCIEKGGKMATEWRNKLILWQDWANKAGL